MTSRSPREVSRPAVERGARREPAMFERGREVHRIRRVIERLESPRLQMMLIVALTGAAGFLASFVMLALGLHAMWLRYPLATVFAYGIFLALIWTWLRLRDQDPHDSDQEDAADAFVDAADAVLDTRPMADDASFGPDFDLDAGGVDLDEGVVLAVAIAALVALAAALWAAFAIVGAAPVLLAELAVDAALAGGLYRRVRALDRGRYWLRTAIARTAWRFAGVAALFAAAGEVAAWLVPGADSFGDIWR